MVDIGLRKYLYLILISLVVFLSEEYLVNATQVGNWEKVRFRINVVVWYRTMEPLSLLLLLSLLGLTRVLYS